jgi:hypothetical protein
MDTGNLHHPTESGSRRLSGHLLVRVIRLLLAAPLGLPERGGGCVILLGSPPRVTVDFSANREHVLDPRLAVLGRRDFDVRELGPGG